MDPGRQPTKDPGRQPTVEPGRQPTRDPGCDFAVKIQPQKSLNLQQIWAANRQLHAFVLVVACEARTCGDSVQGHR